MMRTTDKLLRYKESYKNIKQFEGNENPLTVAKDFPYVESCGFRSDIFVCFATY